MAKTKYTFRPGTHGNFKPSGKWSESNATPIAHIKSWVAKADKVGFESQRVGHVTVAPWVCQAYAAENIERAKKKLKPLAWKRFGDLFLEDKSRKKMLIADKFMRAARKATGK